MVFIEVGEMKMKEKAYLSVVDYLRQRDKKRYGKGTAIEFDGNQISRDEYWRLVDHYRNYFISQGFFYGCQKPVTICKKTFQNMSLCSWLYLN